MLTGKHLRISCAVSCMVLGLALVGCQPVKPQKTPETQKAQATQDSQRALEQSLAAADPTVFKTFKLQMLQAVDKKKVYPKEAILSNKQGTAVMVFDYIGGNKATNIHLAQSAGDKSLNEAAVKALEDAELPPKPPGFEALTLFRVAVNFYLNSANVPVPVPASPPPP